MLQSYSGYLIKMCHTKIGFCNKLIYLLCLCVAVTFAVSIFYHVFKISLNKLRESESLIDLTFPFSAYMFKNEEVLTENFKSLFGFLQRKQLLHKNKSI